MHRASWKAWTMFVSEWSWRPCQAEAFKHINGIDSLFGVYLNPFIKSDTSDQVCLINIKFLYSESWLNHSNFNIKHLSPSVWVLRKYEIFSSFKIIFFSPPEKIMNVLFSSHQFYTISICLNHLSEVVVVVLVFHW